MTLHGFPSWFELNTSDLDAAATFYAAVFGWAVADSQMIDFDYRIAQATDGVGAGGLMSALPPGVPPHWLIYFGAQDADAAVAATEAAGGKVWKAPETAPGVGRFAVLADPQGAAFGVLQPDPATAGQGGAAFNQRAQGHGNWLELMSTDPVAGFAFYAALFGWTKGDAMDMGEMGTYQLFKHDGADIGGMMGLGDAPVPNWLPYFGSNGVNATIEAIKAAGGRVHVGPVEVPGPAHVAIAQDPQGAWFAIVGPLEPA
ncbi:VOC family protein [Paracoccus sp. p4-l81]|uniref:VOC family protein n=1 Tax=unclassified Paracoccus (in: a-proteobacteria) TaxID=2688777 RepID=UPI0035BA5B9D